MSLKGANYPGISFLGSLWLDKFSCKQNWRRATSMDFDWINFREQIVSWQFVWT